jgi:tRNA threonylcarbamoyladenosine biosynthesis protein TsaE
VTASEAETEALGAALVGELAPDGVLLLSGDLGSGKTVLTRGLAGALGVPPGEVQSPTYTLIREHKAEAAGEGGGGRLFHVDLYRLSPEEAADLGLEELLAGPGVKVVEWAERLGFDLPGALRLTLRRISAGAAETGEAREIVEMSRPEGAKVGSLGREPQVGGEKKNQP